MHQRHLDSLETTADAAEPSNAQDLIWQTLRHIPSKRLTASQALEHAWMEDMTYTDDQLPDVLNRLMQEVDSMRENEPRQDLRKSVVVQFEKEFEGVQLI